MNIDGAKIKHIKEGLIAIKMAKINLFFNMFNLAPSIFGHMLEEQWWVFSSCVSKFQIFLKFYTHAKSNFIRGNGCCFIYRF